MAPRAQQAQALRAKLDGWLPMDDNGHSALDYYKVLALPTRYATVKTIEAAVESNTRNNGQDFQLFDPVNEAAVVLLDPSKRTAYDALYDTIRSVHDAFEKGLMKRSHDPQAIDNVLAEKVRQVLKGTISEIQPGPSLA